MRNHRKSLANSRHHRHRAERRLRPLQRNNQLLRDNLLRPHRVSLLRNRREFQANRHLAECRRADLREHREPQPRQASPFRDPA